MMNRTVLLLAILLIGVVAFSVYYNYLGPQQSEQAYNIGDYNTWEPATESSSHGTGYVAPSPKVTVIVAYRDDCTNCQAILNHLQGKNIILKKLNVDDQRDLNILKSELSRRGVEYVGIPTVIIGDLVFYSYQTSEQCPYINETATTATPVKVGEEVVTFCRVPDYTRYFIYIPSQVDSYLALCDKYHDDVCYE